MIHTTCRYRAALATPHGDFTGIGFEPAALVGEAMNASKRATTDSPDHSLRSVTSPVLRALAEK